MYLIFFQDEKKIVFIGAKRNHCSRYVFQQQKPPACVFNIFSLNRTQYLLAYMYRLKGINNGVANVCLPYEGWKTCYSWKQMIIWRNVWRNNTHTTIHYYTKERVLTMNTHYGNAFNTIKFINMYILYKTMAKLMNVSVF